MKKKITPSWGNTTPIISNSWYLWQKKGARKREVKKQSAVI